MILLLTIALQAVPPAATPAPSPAAAPAPLAAAPWTPHIKLDPVTNRSTGTVWAISQDGRARLVVRCDRNPDNIVSVQFIPTPPFPPATRRPVSIKIDDEPPLGANWQFPGKGAIIADDVIVTNLTVAIAHARQIKVHVIDPSDKPIDAVFVGPGSEAPIKQVLESCGYTFGVSPTPNPVPSAAGEGQEP